LRADALAPTPCPSPVNGGGVGGEGGPGAACTGNNSLYNLFTMTPRKPSIPDGSDPDFIQEHRLIRTSERMQRLARELRQRMTPAEKVLWQALRGHQLDGLRFRRQHPFRSCIVDFYCPARRLVVEVDGLIHLAEREADAARGATLAELGLRVLRITNDEVLRDLPGTLERIRRACEEQEGRTS